ncbi:MAG: glycosyltransferase [Prevotellaceae bacterium]|jgi:glycosyltransferase involved in cell wall biosynthesis/GT2 family glycosyltransferase|nr:glycosyltransferase [Prevotellaceae bacterium]
MAKILHVSKYYYPFFGGIEDVAQTVINELKPYHNQRVICFNHHKGDEQSVENGIPVTRVSVAFSLTSQPITFSFIRHLQKIIDEFRPDYVHLHLPNPLVSLYVLKANLYSAKLVTHWHADILGQKMIYSVYRFYEKKIIERSDKILATSEIYRLASKPLKNFAYKTEILPNTVNEDKFLLAKNDEEKILELKKRFDNKKILFSVGRHVPYKGINYLLDAAKLIDNDCKIVIAGSGFLTKYLKKRAKNIQNVYFIGRVSDEDLKLFLYASTVYVFPSHTRSEAFGVALAEALYCGLPAVSFNIEGSGMIWVNKDKYSGFVVQNRDTQAFADAVNQLLRNENLRKEMSINAKKWICKNFLKEQIINVLSKIYEIDNEIPKKPLINVSIVLYNNKLDKISNLISTIRKSSLVNKIYLIDNSPKRCQEFENLQVTYIFNDRNIGYGRGHNIALNQTIFDNQAAYHLAMNADLTCDAEIIDEITAYMQENQDVGSLMPKVFYPNGKIQYLCRLLPDPMDLIVRRFLPKFVMKTRVARLEMRDTDYNHIINVPHISGCFMFLRTEILKKTGLFDERYFLYLEDIDLTRRIQQVSRTIFYPKVSIIHEHRQGSYNSLRLLVVHIYSAIKYFNKWGWFSDKERDRINKKTIEESNLS